MFFLTSVSLKLRFLRSKKGFTLIELLVAMAILTLIIFAFTPLLVTSIERIHYAGDKSEALYEGQSEVEVNIAERITEDGFELVFTYETTYGTTDITVPGGLVDVEKSKGDAIAWLSGFVPYIPTIDLYLSPLPLVEGYNNIDIILMAKNTTGKTALEKAVGGIVTVYDVNGFKVEECSFTILDSGQIEAIDGLPEGYDQYARFTLSAGLTNSRSPYMPSLKWVLQEEGKDDIEVYVETRLQVVLPYAVAVGAGQNITISPDHEIIWKTRSHNAMGSGSFTDIIWTGFEYAAVSSSDRVILWKDRQEPAQVYQASATLNSIAYGAGHLVAVGDGGLVVTSPDRSFWTAYSAGSSNLEAVSHNGSKFVAVGANGAIMSSTDGENWSPETVTWVEVGEDGSVLEEVDGSAVTFKGVAHGGGNGGKWLAVGKKAIGDIEEGIIYSSTGGDWEKVNYVFNHGLNDIIYDGSRFIVVGDNGTVMSSTSGDDWVPISLGTSNNLNAIAFAEFTQNIIHYVIAGDSGTIITNPKSSNGSYVDQWIIQTSGTTSNLNGVALRWTP